MVVAFLVVAPWTILPMDERQRTHFTTWHFAKDSCTAWRILKVTEIARPCARTAHRAFPCLTGHKSSNLASFPEDVTPLVGQKTRCLWTTEALIVCKSPVEISICHMVVLRHVCGPSPHLSLHGLRGWQYMQSLSCQAAVSGGRSTVRKESKMRRRHHVM